MDNAFVYNTELYQTQIQDTIQDRINKAKAVITCLMFSVEFLNEDVSLDNSTIFHALWAVDGFLEEIELLQNKLNQKCNS